MGSIFLKSISEPPKKKKADKVKPKQSKKEKKGKEKGEHLQIYILCLR